MTGSETSSAETPASDTALIARVLGGDSAAYKVLVKRHERRALRYAYRRLRDRDDADDVVQEAFDRAYRSLQNYEDRSGFGAWFFRILSNQCNTWFYDRRSRKRREQHWVKDKLLVHGTAGGLLIDELTTGEDALADLCGRCTQQAIERALGKLPPRYRDAFVFRYVDELSYEEIAARTGESVSAWKQRASRACNMLGSLLESDQGELAS